MVKLYNTQADFTTNFENLLSNICPQIRKTQLNIIPSIIYGMITGESSVSTDIALHLKNAFSEVQFDSVVRRIRRFYNNKIFSPYDFYDSIITYVVSNYKLRFPNSRVHIVIDHMFSKENYLVLMFTMRIGKQGIPIWFRCFKKGNFSGALQTELIIQGIDYVYNLFKDFNVVFLADRWFGYEKILAHISSLNLKYCIRMRKMGRVLIYDKVQKHKIWKNLADLSFHKYHSVIRRNVELFESQFTTDLVFSKYENTSDPWIIATNSDTKWATYDYSHRFGAIECVFKNQKSNCFRIETINNASITSFTNMYTLVCTAVLFLTILGTDYAKNKTNVYRHVKITTHKNYKNKGKVRVMSLFKTGLTLIKLAFNSAKYIRIPYSLTLYDY